MDILSGTGRAPPIRHLGCSREQLRAGIATHEPFTHFGQALRVSDPRQRFRKPPDRVLTEPRRRLPAQERPLLRQPLFDAFPNPLFRSLSDVFHQRHSRFLQRWRLRGGALRRSMEIPIGLQPHPELGGSLQQTRQPQGRVWRDPPFSEHDFVEAVR